MPSFATVPLEELVDASVGAAEGGAPMVFFLGAGASRPSPSCLPSPETIQRAVLDQVAPIGTGSEKAHLEDSLPEIYHEILAHLGGPSTMEIWRSLSFWESPSQAPGLMAFGLGPNLVHLLTVYLAWRCRTPVVTVNFDQLLERAAEQLGLNPVLNPGESTKGDSVAIWKLHGSVDDIDSIRTTLQSITASSPSSLKAIHREFLRARGCLIGYSGRDIDFFPFLCEWKDARPIYWLDPNFKKTAIERFSDPFQAIDGVGGEVWARETIERLPVIDSRVEALKAKLGRHLPEAKTVDAAYRKAVEARAESLFQPIFGGQEGRRILVHALALAAIGRNGDAWDWLDRFFAVPRPAELECRGELLRSALSHEHSRYLDSRAYADRALRLAKGSRLRHQAMEAVLAADEGRRMSSTARFRVVRAPISARSVSEPAAALLIMTWHALRFLPGQIPWRRDGGARPAFDRLRARFAYLEHLIRLGGFVQGIAERVLPDPVVRILGQPCWSLLRAWSERIGYAAGIGNAKKYQLRRVAGELREAAALPASSVYELISSPTGSALDLRDRAETADTTEAAALFDRAIAMAQLAGNASLVLKAMEGKKKIEPGYAPVRPEVEALLDRLQGGAYDRIKSDLLTFLTG